MPRTPPLARGVGVCAASVCRRSRWGLLVLGTTLAYGDRPAESTGDVQDVLFLGGGPPILIRIHVLISYNGGYEQPSSAAWREAVGKLHAYLDTNGDKVLSRAGSRAGRVGPARSPLRQSGRDRPGP